MAVWEEGNVCPIEGVEGGRVDLSSYRLTLMLPSTATVLMLHPWQLDHL